MDSQVIYWQISTVNNVTIYGVCGISAVCTKNVHSLQAGVPTDEVEKVYQVLISSEKADSFNCFHHFVISVPASDGPKDRVK